MTISFSRQTYPVRKSKPKPKRLPRSGNPLGRTIPVKLFNYLSMNLPWYDQVEILFRFHQSMIEHFGKFEIGYRNYIKGTKNTKPKGWSVTDTARVLRTNYNTTWCAITMWPYIESDPSLKQKFKSRRDASRGILGY